MEILDLLEKKLFSEMTTLDFEEVRRLFNYYAYYISKERSEDFLEEAIKCKNIYAIELEKINEYANKEYTVLADNAEKYNKKINFEDEPSYMLSVLEGKTKADLIRLIKKFYDEKIFNDHKLELRKILSIKVPTAKEVNYYDLHIIMVKNHKYIESILSMIGYYSRHYNYFLSKRDQYKICNLYTREVNIVNPTLINDDEYNSHYLNVFGSWGRIRDPYIGVDKMSLEKLVFPYLKTNVNELTEMIKIYVETMRMYKGEQRYKIALEKVHNYVLECKKSNLMIEVK